MHSSIFAYLARNAGSCVHEDAPGGRGSVDPVVVPNAKCCTWVALEFLAVSVMDTRRCYGVL